MPSRIDVELTSSRPDGTWTWRAAGAREPRGVVDASVLPSGAKVGDVLKVEATIALDGIEIHSVVPSRSTRKEPDRIEILGGSEFQAVTTSLVGRRSRDDGDRREGRDGNRRDRPRREGDRRPGGGRGPREGGGPTGRQSGERGPREGETGTARPPRERRERPSYTPVPEVPQRPKPKRLKPGRVHRQALIASLPDEQKPIAEQLFLGGLPGVRQALKDQNTGLRAEGKPEIKTSGIESLAQDLLPRIRVADWLDRADAARSVVDDLDLRDLRSVVTAGADPGVARDDSTRELSAELRAALDRRQNEEHEQWLGDITAALEVGRVVRALRLSSRPPKAGVRFPPELATRLAAAATASLTQDAASDRWAAVIEALAFSPVHALVVPAAPPQQISDDLRAMVKGVASAVPEIAKLLGVDVPPPGSRPARPPRLPRRPTKPKAAAGSARPSPTPAPAKVTVAREPAAPPALDPTLAHEAAPAEEPADGIPTPVDTAPADQPAHSPAEATPPPEPAPAPPAEPALSAVDTAPADQPAHSPAEATPPPEPAPAPDAVPAEEPARSAVEATPPDQDTTPADEAVEPGHAR